VNQQLGFRLLASCLDMRRELNKLISTGHLSQGEYLVLRNVWLTKTAKAAELSAILQLSRPSISRILNDLEGRGLITRRIDESDRRSIDIELTEAGVKAVQRANRGLLRIAERVVDGLGESDTERLIHLLEKLTDIYKQMVAESEGERDE